MLVFFLLQEVVVVACLGEEFGVDAAAVGADLFDGGAEGFFIGGKERSVFVLFVGVEGD
jgi:hypothetical protein